MSHFRLMPETRHLPPRLILDVRHQAQMKKFLILIWVFTAICLFGNADTADNSDAGSKISDKIHHRCQALVSKAKKETESKLFCEVVFYVRRDGSLKSAEVSRSSDVSWYDSICLRSVRESAPFPKLPASYFDESGDGLLKIAFAMAPSAK